MKAKEEKIMAKRLKKDAKEKLEELKSKQFEQQNVSKQRDKEIEVLMKEKKKSEEKQRVAAEKETKLLDKQLEKNEKINLKELKKKQKEADSEAKRLLKERSTLQKEEQKEGKNQTCDEEHNKLKEAQITYEGQESQLVLGIQRLEQVIEEHVEYDVDNSLEKHVKFDEQNSVGVDSLSSSDSDSNIKEIEFSKNNATNDGFNTIQHEAGDVCDNVTTVTSDDNDSKTEDDLSDIHADDFDNTDSAAVSHVADNEDSSNDNVNDVNQKANGISKVISQYKRDINDSSEDDDSECEDEEEDEKYPTTEKIKSTQVLVETKKQKKKREKAEKKERRKKKKTLIKEQKKAEKAEKKQRKKEQKEESKSKNDGGNFVKMILKGTLQNMKQKKDHKKKEKKSVLKEMKDLGGKDKKKTSKVKKSQKKERKENESLEQLKSKQFEKENVSKQRDKEIEVLMKEKKKSEENQRDMEEKEIKLLAKQLEKNEKIKVKEKEQKQNKKCKNVYRDVILNELTKFKREDGDELTGFRKGEKEFAEFLNLVKIEENILQKEQDKLNKMKRSNMLHEFRNARKDNCVKTVDPTKLAHATFSKWKYESTSEEGTTELLLKANSRGKQTGGRLTGESKDREYVVDQLKEDVLINQPPKSLTDNVEISMNNNIPVNKMKETTTLGIHCNGKNNMLTCDNKTQGQSKIPVHYEDNRLTGDSKMQGQSKIPVHYEDNRLTGDSKMQGQSKIPVHYEDNRLTGDSKMQGQSKIPVHYEDNRLTGDSKMQGQNEVPINYKGVRENKNIVLKDQNKDPMTVAKKGMKTTERCHDNSDMPKQSDTLQNHAQNMISIEEHESLKSRIVMLTETIEKLESERVALKEQILQLKINEMSLEDRLVLAQRFCENSNERRHDEARQGLDFRQKYLDIEEKFDEYKKRSAIEKKNMLHNYKESSSKSGGPLEIEILKQRIFELEMDLQSKDEVLDQIDSINIKTKYMEDLLKELQIQTERSVVINARQLEEEELVRMHQNRKMNFLMEQKILDTDKANKIKELTQNQEKLLRSLAEKDDEIYNLKNNAEINDTISSPVNESIRQREYLKQQKIKSQIIVDPDIKKRPAAEKTVLDEVINCNKKQKFQIKEMERAVYYLFKEIVNERAPQGPGNEHPKKRGSSIVDSIIGFMTNSIEEMKKNVRSIDVKEIEQIITTWNKGTFSNSIFK